MLLRKYYLLVFLFVFSFPIRGALVLENIKFNVTKSVSSYYLTNTDENESLYVKTEIFEVTEDTNGGFVEKGLSSHHDFIISPSYIIVPPGSQVKYKVYSKVDEFKIYRVRFLPMNVSSNLKGLSKLRVNLNFSYGVIFYVNPKNKVYDTKVVDKDNGLELFNNGDSIVILEDVASCASNGENCTQMDEYFIRPKKSLSIDGSVISLTLVEGDTKRDFNFLSD